MDRAMVSRALRRIGFVLVCLLAGAASAPAQDSGVGGFLSHLFGAPAARAPDPGPPLARKPRRKVRDFVPATATRAPGSIGGGPVQANFFIDVIGDSIAVMASDGLTEAFIDKPEVSVVDKAHDASGLVREDYFDWIKAAGEIAADKGKVDFVVVMLGINDVQALRDGADSLEPLTDRWRDRYGERVEAVAAPFQAAHIPVAWVGLPPMHSDRFNAQAIKLNEIYKDRAERAGAKYIDIWDAFADQNGQYDAFGPNIDGQNVKLRSADGIRFTKAGARKLAHFIEAEIRKTYDKERPASDLASLPPDIEQAADDINAQIRREMGAPPLPGAVAPLVPPRPLAGPILSLTAHPLSPGGVLASRSASGVTETALVLRVIRRGEPADAHAGRADDFSWPHL